MWWTLECFTCKINVIFHALKSSLSESDSTEMWVKTITHTRTSIQYEGERGRERERKSIKNVLHHRRNTKCHYDTHQIFILGTFKIFKIFTAAGVSLHLSHKNVSVCRFISAGFGTQVQRFFFLSWKAICAISFIFFFIFIFWLTLGSPSGNLRGEQCVLKNL